MTPTFDDLYQTVIVRGETLDPRQREEVFHAYRAASKTGLTTIAVLLAQSQIEMASPKAWLAYAEEATGLTRSECYHRAKVGKLLLDLRDNRVLYRKLINLTGAKLLAIARIPVEHIPGFLAVTDVDRMEIKEVRFEVEKELCRIAGKPLPVRDETPELPGFADLMDGITALGDKLSDGVCDDDAAEKTMQNGLNLCTCAISYEWAQSRKHGYAAVNRTRLLEAKAALLDQLNSINALLDGALAPDKEGNDYDETPEIETDLCDEHTADAAGNGPAARGQTGGGDAAELCDEHTTCEDGRPAGKPGGEVRPTADGGESRGDGTGEVPRVLQGGEADEPDDPGHHDRNSGGDRAGGGVSDPDLERSAG